MDQKQHEPIRVRDRRHWANPSPDTAEPSGPAQPQHPTYVAELEQKLAAAEAQVEEVRAAYRRLKDDEAQTQARWRREAEEARVHLAGEVLAPFLEVIDDLRRSLKATGADPESQRRGLGLALDGFDARLTKLGVVTIATTGARFDPRQHEALMTRPCEPESDGLVLEEVQRGYTIGEVVIRPARVLVGRAT